MFFIESPKNIELLDGSKIRILIPLSYCNFHLSRNHLHTYVRSDKLCQIYFCPSHANIILFKVHDNEMVKI